MVVVVVVLVVGVGVGWVELVCVWGGEGGL